MGPIIRGVLANLHLFIFVTSASADCNDHYRGSDVRRGTESLIFGSGEREFDTPIAETHGRDRTTVEHLVERNDPRFSSLRVEHTLDRWIELTHRLREVVADPNEAMQILKEMLDAKYGDSALLIELAVMRVIEGYGLRVVKEEERDFVDRGAYRVNSGQDVLALERANFIAGIGVALETTQRMFEEFSGLDRRMLVAISLRPGMFDQRSLEELHLNDPGLVALRFQWSVSSLYMGVHAVKEHRMEELAFLVPLAIGMRLELDLPIQDLQSFSRSVEVGRLLFAQAMLAEAENLYRLAREERASLRSGRRSGS